MVRFSPLQYDGRSGFRQAVLPQRRSADSNTQLIRHLFRRLPRAPGRRLHLRPLRRPHRPQVDTHRHLALDGHFDLPGRVPARLCVDRHLGRRSSHCSSPDSGHRRRRRMGWLGAVVHGMGAAQQGARLSRLMAAIRRPSRSRSRQSCRSAVQQDVGRRFSCLGLAHSVCSEHHPRRHRPVDQAAHPGNAGVSQSRQREKNRAGADRRSLQEAVGAPSSSARWRAPPSRARSTSSPRSSSPTARRCFTHRATCC